MEGFDLTPRASPIWDNAYHIKTFREFASQYPAFVYRQAVAESVRRKLDIVHKLLLHSYYEYEFLDIVSVRALQVVEMALRVRHYELEGTEDVFKGDRKLARGKSELACLIKWADGKGLLEESEDRTQLLRRVRNFMMHSRAETLYGITGVQLPYSIVDFINELYEDPVIRSKRHAIEMDLSGALKRITANGALLQVADKKWIIFHASVQHCALDSVSGAMSLYTAFMRIFDPTEKNGSVEISDPMFGQYTSYHTSDDSVRLTDGNGLQVTVRPITEQKYQDRYDTFMTTFREHPHLDLAVRIPISDYRRQVKRASIEFDRDSFIAMNPNE